MVGRRHREIAFLVARAITEIVFHAARVPAAFFRVDEVEPVLLALIEAHIVKNKELRLGTEICGIRQAGRAEIHLRLPGNVAGIPVVALFGYRINDVRHHHQGWRFGEGIEHVGAGIGNQQHVALVNGGPAANGGAIHAEALFKRIFRELVNGVGNVVPQAGEVGEAEVEQLDSIFLHELHHGLGIGLRISHETLLCAGTHPRAELANHTNFLRPPSQ